MSLSASLFLFGCAFWEVERKYNGIRYIVRDKAHTSNIG
jgi:hypothetical protein